MTDPLRPTPSVDDPAAVQTRLQEWLNATVFDSHPVTLSNLTIPEGTGMSNVTVLFDARWRDARAERSVAMVGRIQAQGENLAFPHYDLPMQYAVMDALGSVDGLRLPRLVALEASGDVLGVPFYIMEKTEGLIPPDMPPYHMDGWIVASTPQQRERMWWAGVDMMATLHRQHIDDEPLAGFNAAHDFPRGLDAQLDYWDDYMRWGFEGAHNAHAETALAWLRGNRPAEQVQRLCWGDSRMANVIFTPDKREVAALLDWEMLCLGDPQQDIAWWIYMDELFSRGIGVERLAGFPSRQATLERWAMASGLDGAALDYYLVFAALRIDLIIARMSLASGDGSLVGGGFVNDYLAKTLDAIT